jgi:hypothetical protein
MSKHDLRARPVYHRKPDSSKAHHAFAGGTLGEHAGIIQVFMRLLSRFAALERL